MSAIKLFFKSGSTVCTPTSNLRAFHIILSALSTMLVCFKLSHSSSCVVVAYVFKLIFTGVFCYTAQWISYTYYMLI